MNKNKLTFLKIVIVAVLGTTISLGCEKKEVLETPKLDEKEILSNVSNISITDLKVYLGEITHSDTSAIRYETNSNIFTVNEKMTIGYDALKKMFLEHPIVHYVDGKPVAAKN